MTPESIPLIKRIIAVALPVAVVTLLSWPVAAQPASPVGEGLLAWSDVVYRALDTWDARYGAAVDQQRQGYRDARSWQGGRLTDALIMPVPGVGIRPDSPGSGDNYITAIVRMEARNLAPLRQASLDATVDAVVSEADRFRFDFAMQVVQHWLALWQATSLTTHLQQDLREFESMVTVWMGQDPEGFVTTADRAELQTELARIQFELGEARWAVTAAEQQLRAVLQSDDLPRVDDFPDLADAAEAIDPWGMMAERIDDHPAFVQQRAQSEAMAAAARLAWNGNPTIVGLGTEIHDSWMGQFYVAAVLEVTVPLSRRHRVAASVDLAAAERAVQDVRVAREVLLSQLRAERTMWVERSHHLAELQATWINPLKQRVDVWQQRALSGLPDFPAYVAAQRALHEAEHALYAEELTSAAQYFYAAAMVDTITEIQQ